MRKRRAPFSELPIGECFTMGETGNFTYEKINDDDARNLTTGQIVPFKDYSLTMLTCERPSPNVGDRVKLRPDVLKKHSRKIPAHAGFTIEQFKWREVLSSLEGHTGIVTRTFPNSKHVNVDFNGQTIGIDHTELMTGD
jgi:hypothetical protein